MSSLMSPENRGNITYVNNRINTKPVDLKSVKKAAIEAIADGITSSELKELLLDEESKYERKDDLISTQMGFSIFLGCFIFPVAYFFGVSFYRSLLETERYRIEYKIFQTKAQQLQDNIG